jgi:hypothetical protein
MWLGRLIQVYIKNYIMKKILFILTLNSLIATAQNNTEEIKKLEKNKKLFSEKIISLNDSIKSIDLIINTFKSKDIIQRINDSSFVALAKEGTKLRKTPHPVGDIILTLSKNTEVLILDYYDGYFGVCANSICGYVNEMWIQGSSRIDELITVKRQERKEFERLKKENKIKKENKEYAEIERKNIAKYGKTLYDKLKKGYYWLGMTDSMAIISLGSPNDINRTVGSWGVHEQWVYDGNYYYFENGKMTSYQN